MYLSKKNINDLFLKEIKMLRKTKSYSEMHKYLKFYEAISAILNDYQDIIKIIEINESPFILDETFQIYLSSFILYIKNYEYLAFMQSEEIETFDIEKLTQMLNLFSKYHNKKGILIIWNDWQYSSLLLDKNILYESYEDLLMNLKIKVQSFRKILSKLTERKLSDKKIEIKQFLMEDFNILEKLSRKLKKKYENTYLDIIKQIPHYTNGKKIDQILTIIDDCLMNGMNEEDIKNELLRIYKYKF